MLGDAARLVRRDIGLAQGVEQRGLAVIDMAHDGDDRRAGNRCSIDILGAFQADLDVRGGNPAELWPNSPMMSSAVSASIGWLMVAMTPIFISALMTSAPRSAMRLASSRR